MNYVIVGAGSRPTALLDSFQYLDLVIQRVKKGFLVHVRPEESTKLHRSENFSPTKGSKFGYPRFNTKLSLGEALVELERICNEKLQIASMPCAQVFKDEETALSTFCDAKNLECACYIVGGKVVVILRNPSTLRWLAIPKLHLNSKLQKHPSTGVAKNTGISMYTTPYSGQTTEDIEGLLHDRGMRICFIDEDENPL